MKIKSGVINNTVKSRLKSSATTGGITIKTEQRIVPANKFNEIPLDVDLNSYVIDQKTNSVQVSLVNDMYIVGGMRVVDTIEDRDKINCCYRKTGMVVMVIGKDYSFNEYVLTSKDPCENQWEEVTVDDSNVELTDDFSDLNSGVAVTSQRELNKLFRDLITNPDSSDKNYIHDQPFPSKSWSVKHPLNKKVSVTVVDTAGTVIEGEVTINDGNVVTVEFSHPFSGQAILN